MRWEFWLVEVCQKLFFFGRETVFLSRPCVFTVDKYSHVTQSDLSSLGDSEYREIMEVNGHCSY